MHTAPDARPIAQVPPVDASEVRARIGGRQPAVFLDYDGTLTPIVDDPDAATIDDDVRDVLRRLAQRCTVAVVSGRDLDDVRQMVAVAELAYAGSHGLDIAAGGRRTEKGSDYLPSLEAAESRLRRLLEHVRGARVERKRFAIAIHYRQADADRYAEVEDAVRSAAAAVDGLRVTGGKMIFELRPALDWDKGKALRFLLDTLRLPPDDVVPLYIGDDVTDEDAFREIARDGLSLVVRGEDDRRSTLADFALDDPAETVVFLRQLAEALRG